MSSVSNGPYFLTLPLVSVMRVMYRKIRHARYLYIKRNVEKVWGARYLSKNTVNGYRIFSFLNDTALQNCDMLLQKYFYLTTYNVHLYHVSKVQS